MTRRVLVDGLTSLIEFVNHRGPWAELWGGQWDEVLPSGQRCVISGEPFSETSAEALRLRLREQMRRVQQGRAILEQPLRITVTYHAYANRVDSDVYGDDLAEYLHVGRERRRDPRRAGLRG